MAIGDVGTGQAREGVDERRGILSLPDGMADAVGGRQVVEGGRLHRGGDQAIDLRAAAMGQEHRLGVRLERQDVARAVVLLVRARALVLSDHVALVVGDGDAPDHPDLGPCAHHLAIHEERRIGIAHQHPVRGEAVEIPPRLLVHPRVMRVDVLGQVDVGADDVQSSLAGGKQRPAPAHDVYGGRRRGRPLGHGAQRAKGTELHARDRTARRRPPSTRR